jgi:hypothetical protein
LTTLNLDSSRIGDAGAIGLCEGLRVNATLTDLNLRSNKISDAAALALADVLQVNETLTELNLRLNQIGDAGAIGLGAGLAVNTTLTTLYLNDNKIGNKGKSAIRTAWLSKSCRQESDPNKDLMCAVSIFNGQHPVENITTRCPGTVGQVGSSAHESVDMFTWTFGHCQTCCPCRRWHAGAQSARGCRDCDRTFWHGLR